VEAVDATALEAKILLEWSKSGSSAIEWALALGQGILELWRV